MKKLFSVLTLTLLAVALLIPVLSFAEAIAPEGTTESAPVVTLVPVAIPSDTAITPPATGYDWASLASIAGATAFTLLFVQFVKAPLDRLWHIPTRVVVYIIAFATLLLAQVFTAGFSLDILLLTAVNAVIAASAAMGAYEMTFAKKNIVGNP